MGSIIDEFSNWFISQNLNSGLDLFISHSEPVIESVILAEYGGIAGDRLPIDIIAVQVNFSVANLQSCIEKSWHAFNTMRRITAEIFLPTYRIRKITFMSTPQNLGNIPGENGKKYYRYIFNIYLNIVPYN